MPELPEVEVLVRHLRPALCDRGITSIRVFRPRVVRPNSEGDLRRALIGARFREVRRRGKYLVFELAHSSPEASVTLVGHLGMTGRMFVSPSGEALPKHAAVVLGLGEENFVFQDTRYFGRLNLDQHALARLGPEPLSPEFTSERFAESLRNSRQPIKVKLLDQSAVAGVGNIYASEALFRAGISPTRLAGRLTAQQIKKLRQAIRTVLKEAIRCGSTIPLNYSGVGEPDGLFYFGRRPGSASSYEERLKVYDRFALPCFDCGTRIKRIVQTGRSTFFCPRCQRAK